LVATPGKVLPYPNPVIGPGPVQILFNLNASGDVNLKVFSIAFRRVLTVDLGVLGTGPQKGTFPLTDGGGKDLANGLYYLVVEQGQDRFIGKLLVQR
jgi:hypothetical protein